MPRVMDDTSIHKDATSMLRVTHTSPNKTGAIRALSSCYWAAQCVITVHRGITSSEDMKGGSGRKKPTVLHMVTELFLLEVV